MNCPETCGATHCGEPLWMREQPKVASFIYDIQILSEMFQKFQWKCIHIADLLPQSLFVQ